MSEHRTVVQDIPFTYSFHDGFESSVEDETEKRAALDLLQTKEMGVSYLTAEELRYIADKLDEHEYYHYTQDQSNDELD